MSAVPNIPETITHSIDSQSDEARTNSRIGVKENRAFHVEDTFQTNGSSSNAKSESNGTSFKRPWKLHDVAVENHRPMKIIVIGAGYSGIYCGIRIPEKIRNCELTIYEKNAGYGGAWYENRYPGCACDVPCKYPRKQMNMAWNSFG